MTIVTVLRIPEGIVIGADTQSTIFRLEKEKNSSSIQTIPVNFFRNAQKIFNISPKNHKIKVALVQFGNAMPGDKPLSYHIFNIRDSLENETQIESVEEVITLILNYFKKYEENKLNRLGFFICGFDKLENEFIPHVRLINYYMDKEHSIKIKNDKIKGDNGLSWSGEGSWIITRLLKISDPNQKIPQSEIPYRLLSLKDGIDLTKYFINTVIGFERFQVRFPTCGGSCAIATLTPRKFEFLMN